FEFVIRTTLAAHDLDTAEGRVAALRAAAPVVAGIRDDALRPEYARILAGWLGMDVGTVQQTVHAAGRAASVPHPRARGGAGGRPGASRDDGGRTQDGDHPSVRPAAAVPAMDDPVARLERQVLEVVLQMPDRVDAA